MEALDHEIKLGAIPGDITHIIKGKRTKRQRPQSPIPFTIAAATHSSSSNNGDSHNTNNNHHPIPSPTTSSEFPAGSSATDEDEDTAMCLILLSKGFSQQQQKKPKKVENDEFPVNKFNSKRYLQAPTTAANGKAGIYVYECKTCNRTFPSFQALGGHRASHKKPKTAIVIIEDKRKPIIPSSDEEEPPSPPPPAPHESIKRNSSSSSSLSLQLSTRPMFSNPNKSPKLHECSICGSEFNSGQALGGHMRRHRVPGGPTAAATANTNTKLSFVPMNPIETEIDQDVNRSRNDGLCLDLNLPAPEDDHQRDSKFAFPSKQQQQQSSLVLSTRPTLVNCHY